jgi:hypothetical protein
MRIKKALLVALFFSLSGCSVIYEKALEKINPNFFVQQSNLEEKEKELCTDPQYKVYLDKSPCNLTGLSNTLLSDNSKITDEQKTASEKYRKALQEYRDEKVSFEKKYANYLGKREYEIVESYLIPQSNINYQNLSNGTITWGEYNKQRIEINKEFRRRVDLYAPDNYQLRNRQIQREREDFEVSKKNFIATKPISQFPYQGDITCTLGGNQLPVMACMQKGNITTNIEVRNGEDYSMAQFTRLNIANSIGSGNGIAIALRPNFQIKMQNASSEMTMNLKITDRQSNSVVYQKSAGQFDYISANNNSISRSSQPSNSNSSAYEAEISCGYQPIFICFMKQGGVYGSFNTTLEIRSGNFYKLYQYQDLMNSGALMNVPLGSSFIINAQNSNNTFLLNIKIKDKTTKKVMFEKSAGQFDFIRIRN